MFDAYHKWLGIPVDQRPPTYYQLLGISTNERDPEVIEEAAVRQMAHLRTYQIGPHGADATRLLNEISKARTVLANPAKRKQYDASLARSSGQGREAEAAVQTAAPSQPVPSSPHPDRGPLEFDDEPERPGNRRKARSRNSSDQVNPPRRAMPLAIILGVAAALLLLLLGVPVLLLAFVLSGRPVAATAPDTGKVAQDDAKDKGRLTDADLKDKGKTDKVPVTPGEPPTARSHWCYPGSQACFGPDGAHVLTVVGNSVHVWDLKTDRVVRSLEGHTAPVKTIAVSPDGSSVLTGSDDRTIRQWDYHTGREIRTLEGNDCPVTWLACNKTGELALAIDADNKVKVWSLNDGKLKAAFGGPGATLCAAFAPDSHHVVTGGDDQQLRLWKWADGTQDRAVHVGQTITQVACGGDGIAVCGGTGPILWELKEWKPIYRLRGHTKPAPAVAMSPTGHLTLSGSDDQSVRLWETSTGKELASWNEAAAIKQVAFSNGDTHALAVSADVRVWMLPRNPIPLVFTRNIWKVDETVARVAASPDGKYVLSAGDTVKLWTLANARAVKVFAEKGKGTKGAAADFSSDSKLIAIAPLGDEVVYVWDVERKKEVCRLQGHKGPVLSVALYKEGKNALTGGEDGSWRLWDAQKGTTLEALPKRAGPVTAVAITEDGALAAAGGDDEPLVTLRPATKNKIAFTGRYKTVAIALSHDGPKVLAVAEKELNLLHFGASIPNATHPEGVLCLAMTPDARYLLSGGRDRRVILWEVWQGFKQLAVLDGHEGDVTSVAFIGPDYQKAVSCAADKTIRIWDLAKFLPKMIASKPETKPDPPKEEPKPNVQWIERSPVTAAAYSPDGTRMAIATDRGRVEIFDAKGKSVKQSSHRGTITDLAFSADGKRVVFATAEGATIWAHSAGNGGNLDRPTGVNRFTSVRLSPNEDFLIATGSGKEFWMFDAKSGKLAKTYSNKNVSIVIADLTSDGKNVITGGDDGMLVYWAVTGGSTRFFKDPQNIKEPIAALAFSANDTQVVAAQGKLVRVWAVRGGTHVGNLQGHHQPVISVAFSKDGKHIVSADKDGAIRIWDAQNLKEQRTLEKVQKSIACVAFSPNGKHLLVAGEDGMCLLEWDAK